MEQHEQVVTPSFIHWIHETSGPMGLCFTYEDIFEATEYPPSGTHVHIIKLLMYTGTWK